MSKNRIIIKWKAARFFVLERLSEWGVVKVIGAVEL
ncbi:hypothetical protein COHCIP112018_03482 [Cohnella sp. JJ-181]|nr:hypothetical protein COHCIP112018_03482 [Cohnella sp. JJ-181]